VNPDAATWLRPPTSTPPAPRSILSLTCADAPFRWPVHVGIAASVLVLTLTVAIFVPSIKTVFSLVGATSSIMLVFLLPAAIYLRCGPRVGTRAERGQLAGPDGGGGPWLLRAAAWVLLLLGLGVMGVALGFDLAPGGLFSPPSPPHASAGLSL
jgi:hypothetical protein